MSFIEVNFALRNYEETKSECNIYEAPKCEIIEVQNEGVLCGSVDSYGSSNESFEETHWSGGWDN